MSDKYDLDCRLHMALEDVQNTVMDMKIEIVNQK